MNEVDCPKCGGFSWFDTEGQNVVHKCTCGYLKFVEVTKEGIKVIKYDPPTISNLPRRGTKLSKCLGVLLTNPKEPLTTQEAADRLREPTNDTSSRMMALSHKGLVVKVIDGRGRVGGSTWKVTDEAVKACKGK